jgi:nicotinamidase-related amidase
MRTTTALFVGIFCICGAEPAADSTILLNLRARVELSKGSGCYNAVVTPTRWDARKTAIIVCDMWDKHWSTNATRRVAEMAPRMNDVLVAARKKGALIIHCPSDTMDYYKDSPQRERARQAAKATPRVPLEGWCRLDPKREPPLPIDDSDGGDDTLPQCKQRKAWSHQIDALLIAPEDALTDNAEAYNLLEARGIANVIVMGVHTNMCVLGRPFAIRQLVKQGKNVVLMRDMTDTMYNPRQRPFVSHFTGTDLVVEHIETNWCPTCTSADVLGGKPFRFKDDKRPQLAFVIAEDEYHTDQTLPAFARQQLGRDFRLSFVFGNPKATGPLSGLEVLDEADAVLFSVRRRVLPANQMACVRRFIAAGKPVIGLRTATHAFAPREKAKTVAGFEYWPSFDVDVLGCNYNLHYPQELHEQIQVIPEAHRNPIVAGLPNTAVLLQSSLYKVVPLCEGVTPLVVGRAGDNPPEPVAWIRTRPDGGRVFCTTAGHADDFKSDAFVHLLRNGIYWAAGLPVPAGEASTLPNR